MRLLTLALAAGMAVCCGQSGPVTVEQAVQAALDHNLNLIAERYNISVAEARIVTARLRPNPVLSIGADYQDLLGTGFNFQNGAGPPEGNIRVDFVLERGGKRERRVEAAETARDVARLQVLNTVRTLVLDVQSAFVDVLLSKNSVELARRNLRAFEDIVNVNTVRVRDGDLAQVELARSRVAALQFRNSVLQAEAKLRLAASRLQILMGRTVSAPDFDVSGDLRRQTPALTAADLERQALDARPDLLALRRDQARSLAELRLQLAQGKIDYTLGTMYHRQYDTAHGNSLGFFFSMPLPVFNRNQGEIERARREQEQNEARLRAAEAQVRTEVHNAWLQFNTARELLDSIERDMLDQARDVQSTTEYSYRRGEASFVELLDAERAFNDTMQSYNEARAEYARSLYLIDSISGKGVNP